MDMKDTNIKVTSQFLFCSNSLSMDLYAGCRHKCDYCFVQTQNRNTFKHGNKNNDIKPRNFLKVIKMIKEGNKSERFRFCSYLLSKRQPLHIGGMSDPFPYDIEIHRGHAKRFLKLIGDYPCIWSTKNPIPQYAKYFETGNHILQFSSIGDNELANKIEKGLPSFNFRLKRLIELKPYVKKIVMRLQPFIPFLWSDDRLVSFFDKIAGNVDALTVEFLKKPFNERWLNFSKSVGFDIAKEFDSLKTEGKDKVLDEEYRFKKLLIIKKLCHERSIEFYSAENKFRDMGDSSNCCGVSKNDSDQFQSKLGFCTNKMLFDAKENGSFGFNDIKSAMPIEVQDFTLKNVSTVSVHKEMKLIDYFDKQYKNGFPAKFYRNLKKDLINREICYKFKDDPFFELFSNNCESLPLYKELKK